VCNQFEDIEGKNAKRRMTEADEVEQEKRELVFRKRLDQKFKDFCSRSEKFAAEFKSDIEFEIPFLDLGFSGCHAKSNVTFYPTQSSLVSL